MFALPLAAGETSSFFGAEQCGHTPALALLAYEYAVDRLGQQLVELLANDGDQRCLLQCFALDRLIGGL
jgi:hypothetical protein